MSKRPPKVALYEMVNKARFKSAQSKALAAKKPDGKPETEPEAKLPSSAFSRPKPVRVFADRIELSLSWQLAVITILVILVLFLAFFRLGRMTAGNKQSTVDSRQAAISVETVMPKAKPAQLSQMPVSTAVKTVEPMPMGTGDNVIVITSYHLASHLEPVMQYFAKYGIATEIIQSGSRFLLITASRFENTEKPDSDGYIMKQKIKAIGAGYKPLAGSGFETFGTKPFQDAYGMKIKN